MRLNHGNNPESGCNTLMRWLVFTVLLVMATSVIAQQGTVRSELSASTVTLDESVTLSIIAIGVDGELDTSALDENFDIIGRSSSRQINTLGGSNNQTTSNSVTTWTLELMPRKAGVFTVPAVTVGGLSSELLSLTVNQIPASARQDVFVEATVDTRSPWVQSQVLMTIRVFQGIEIVDGGLSDPSGKDIQVQRIGKDAYSNEERDGRQYSVTERRFALFPQKSGSLEIDPVVLTVSVPANAGQRGIFSSTRKLTRRTDSLQLEVQARPASGTAWWLPASELMLTSTWAGGLSDAKVDQPLTRIVTMRGTGILDSQLPDISIPAVDGVSLYAEEPVKTMVVNERGLQAEQTVKWALIPQREGELVLPAISVEWFNTDTGKTETALLPEELVNVGAATNGSSASALAGNQSSDDTQLSSLSDDADALLPPVPVAKNDAASDLADTTLAAISSNDTTTAAPGNAANKAEDDGVAASIASTASEADSPLSGADALLNRIAVLQTASNRWRFLALMLLTLWVTSLGFVWWRKSRSTARERVAGKRLGAVRKHANAAYQSLAPLAAVDAACAGSDPAAVRGALLEWSARQWPEQPPATLTSLASRFDEGDARELIKALDASLYSRMTSGSLDAGLISRLSELPRHIAAASKAGKPRTDSDQESHSHISSGKTGSGLPEL